MLRYLLLSLCFVLLSGFSHLSAHTFKSYKYKRITYHAHVKQFLVPEQAAPNLKTDEAMFVMPGMFDSDEQLLLFESEEDTEDEVVSTKMQLHNHYAATILFMQQPGCFSTTGYNSHTFSSDVFCNALHRHIVFQVFRI